MPQETILVVGSTGNIGLAAVYGALKASYNVLAIVRNSTSAEKIFKFIDSSLHAKITTVEADIVAPDGVDKVVERVRKGELPAFQHVYSTAGGLYYDTPLIQISNAELKEMMSVNFESNFYAYRATIPYLLAQNEPNSSWTICTGAQGDIAMRASPAMSQGALFSMSRAACRDNASTNIRFNEVYVAFRVEEDSSAAQTGAIKASDFARVYELLLAKKEIRSSRIVVNTMTDVKELRVEERKTPGIYPYGDAGVTDEKVLWLQDAGSN